MADDYWLNARRGVEATLLGRGASLALKVALLPLGVMADRDQPQGGPASRLHRREVLPVGGGTSNLRPSRDERHLMLMFHDGTTWSRTFIIA
jgi:hypothetical protein